MGGPRQHTVPQMILRNFADPHTSRKKSKYKKIHRMNIKSKIIESKPINKVAVQHQFLEQSVDDFLYGLEDYMSSLVPLILEKSDPNDAYQVMIDKQTGEIKQQIFDFIDQLVKRTKSMRTFITYSDVFKFSITDKSTGKSKEFQLEGHPEIFKEFHEAMVTGNVQYLRKTFFPNIIDKIAEFFGDTTQNEELRDKILNQLPEDMGIDENTPTSLKDDYDVFILENFSTIDFITSDCPVITTQFKMGGIEVLSNYFLPLSPRRGIILLPKVYSIPMKKNQVFVVKYPKDEMIDMTYVHTIAGIHKVANSYLYAHDPAILDKIKKSDDIWSQKGLEDNRAPVNI